MHNTKDSIERKKRHRRKIKNSLSGKWQYIIYMGLKSVGNSLAPSDDWSFAYIKSGSIQGGSK